MKRLIIACCLLIATSCNQSNPSYSYNGFDLRYGKSCIVGPYDDVSVGEMITGESAEPGYIILESVHIPGVTPVRRMIEHTTYHEKGREYHAVLYSVNSDTLYVDGLTDKFYNKLVSNSIN